MSRQDFTMTANKLKEARTKYLLASGFALGGYIMLLNTVGLTATIGMFCIHLSINFERSADKLKR